MAKTKCAAGQSQGMKPDIRIQLYLGAELRVYVQ